MHACIFRHFLEYICGACCLLWFRIFAVVFGFRFQDYVVVVHVSLAGSLRWQHLIIHVLNAQLAKLPVRSQRGSDEVEAIHRTCGASRHGNTWCLTQMRRMTRIADAMLRTDRLVMHAPDFTSALRETGCVSVIQKLTCIKRAYDHVWFDRQVYRYTCVKADQRGTYAKQVRIPDACDGLAFRLTRAGWPAAWLPGCPGRCLSWSRRSRPEFPGGARCSRAWDRVGPGCDGCPVVTRHANSLVSVLCMVWHHTGDTIQDTQRSITSHWSPTPHVTSHIELHHTCMYVTSRQSPSAQAVDIDLRVITRLAPRLIDWGMISLSMLVLTSYTSF